MVHACVAACHDVQVLLGRDGAPGAEGLIVPTMNNVEVYNFLGAVADLEPAANDGNPSITRSFLR